MEGFNINFDSMITEYSTQNNAIIPKRLSFDFLSNSAATSQPRSSKKRKFSETTEAVTTKTATRNGTDSLNSSNSSMCTSWEIKLIRTDLVESQSRIKQLQKEIVHQNKIQNELELKFKAKEKALEDEKNQFKNKTVEYERIIKKNRKNDNGLKEELVKVKNQSNLQKQAYDKQLMKQQSEISRLKEELSWKVNDLNNNIGQLTRENEEIFNQLSNTEGELEIIRSVNESLKEKMEEYKTLPGDLEQEKLNSQIAQMRIKELEYEIGSFGDWKSLSNVTQSRMNSMSDLEKETDRLRQNNKNLHDSLGNKLLLEEQVYDLEARLKKFEQNNVDSITLKVQIESLEKELKDWKQIGADYCIQKGAANNPINVRNYIEQLLHRDLLLISEKSSVSTEKVTIQKQLGDFKNQNDTSQKQIESLKKSLKNHQTILLKLQKKLLMVSAERDSQRQLLENYEKDLTITQGVQNVNSNTEQQQNRIRLDMLEKTVSGYKELCAKLEQEILELKGNSDPDSISYIEQYESLRKDMESLRAENEKIFKRKNELEIEVENLTLRHNVIDDDRLKVVHMKINPTVLAKEQIANELVKLRAEVERLKNRNRKLEAGHEEMTARINETMNMTINVKQMQSLQDELKSLQAKNKEKEQVFLNVNQELREVIYMLFGYKVDRFGSSNYRITSMYADTEHDELMFQLNSSGNLDMLETDYSKTLGSFMDQYLRSANGSLPAFTSSLTLELVNRMTSTVTTS